MHGIVRQLKVERSTGGDLFLHERHASSSDAKNVFRVGVLIGPGPVVRRVAVMLVESVTDRAADGEVPFPEVATGKT